MNLLGKLGLNATYFAELMKKLLFCFLVLFALIWTLSLPTIESGLATDKTQSSNQLGAKSRSAEKSRTSDPGPVPPRDTPSDLNVATESDPIIQASFIKQCDFDEFTHQVSQRKEALEQQKDAFLASLGASSDPNKKLLYALFYGEFEQNNRMEPLAAFHREFPDNPDVLRHLLGQCERQPTHQACGEALLEQVIKHHGDNGAYWIQIANFYAKQGKVDAIPQAIRNGINAPYFDEHYFASIRLFLDATEGELAQPFPVRAMTAWGYQAAEPLYVSHVLAYCFTQFKQRTDGTELCVELAETLESRSKIMLNQSIARELMSRARKQKGDSEGARKLKSESEAVYASFPWDDFKLASNLSFFDPALFYDYLDLLENVGEDQARMGLIEEAIALSKNPYYNPCP